MQMRWQTWALAPLLFIIASYFVVSRPDFTTLRGRRVLVCGGSEGIGRSIALLYARHGARVVIVSRSADKLERVAAEAAAEAAAGERRDDDKNSNSSNAVPITAISGDLSKLEVSLMLYISRREADSTLVLCPHHHLPIMPRTTSYFCCPAPL